MNQIPRDVVHRWAKDGRCCLGCGRPVGTSNRYGYCIVKPACNQQRNRLKKNAWYARRLA